MSEEPTYYHGTRRGFSRGGWLTPRTFNHGEGTTAPLAVGGRPRPDAAEHTYMTTSLDLAWVYAWHAVGRGRPKVLIVDPHGVVTRDPEHSRDMEAYRCAGWARVTAVLTEPTVTEDDARRGWVNPACQTSGAT
jgi:Rifampin ADP-ribosyl transferase